MDNGAAQTLQRRRDGVTREELDMLGNPRRQSIHIPPPSSFPSSSSPPALSPYRPSPRSQVCRRSGSEGEELEGEGLGGVCLGGKPSNVSRDGFREIENLGLGFRV